MRIKINQQFLRQELRKIGKHYPELEEKTGINVNRWKHILNGEGFVRDNEVTLIAGILGCRQNDLIDPEYQLKVNTPLEFDIHIQKLYERRKIDIQPAYETMIKNFQKTGRLDYFIGEANRLLSVLFPEDQLGYDLMPALNMIVDEFQRDGILIGSHAELDESKINDIFFVIHDSIYHNSAQQALSIFLYALTLFDVIFLQESIASITQFEIERFGDKADQYCKLTCSLEILRNTLIIFMVKGKLKMEETTADGVTDEIMGGVHLMLLACYKAGQHLNGDYVSSEYVNRTELDSIIANLTRRIRNIGIKVPDPIYNLPGSRFGKHLFMLRNVYLSQKPKKGNNTLTPLETFYMGYLTGNKQ